MKMRPEEPHHHDHEHHEIDEALQLADTKRGRRTLLVAGGANGALMATAGYVAYKAGADSSWIEAVHDLGDMGYYIAPWLATMRTHLNHNRAVRWMRRTAYAAAGLAGLSMTHSVYEAVSDGATRPEMFSVPSQFGIAVANAAIALYVGRRSGETTIDHAALRHAKNDARTSAVAGVSNAAALAFAPFNPIGAVVVGSMTIATEARTIREANEVLSAGDTADD